MSEDRLLNREEVASLLQVTTRTIYNYENTGVIPPPLKVGRRHLWKASALLAYLEARSEKAP